MSIACLAEKPCVFYLGSEWSVHSCANKAQCFISTRLYSSSFFNCTVLCWRDESTVRNVETYDTARQATVENICVLWRMLFACCVTKATYTHSEYVIIIPLPGQQLFREHASMSRSYVHCLSCILTGYQGGTPQNEKLWSKRQTK
jgi:hypothetical protein